MQVSSWIFLLTTVIGAVCFQKSFASNATAGF
ncbi:Hypothetical protein Cp3995_1302 [Corynebacterium pseudotuberculosis 3/99-5]|nr:Hypothetical protein Cp3995_1302 [Corynebacterium pseudotuberculosis 3/99-5]